MTYDFCSVKYSWTEACVKNKGEREKDISEHMRMNMHIWGWQIDGLKKKRKAEKNWIERETYRGREKDKSLYCIIWQGTSPVLSDGGVRMISLTHTYTHTLAFCLCLPLFPLVSLQSRDQPLADRTGPLGSCYRAPQRRDWKALIAALRSLQSRENHSVSVIGSLTWDRGKGGKERGRQKARMKGRLDT